MLHVDKMNNPASVQTLLATHPASSVGGGRTAVSQYKLLWCDSGGRMAPGFSSEQEAVAIKAVSCELNADRLNNTCPNIV